MVVEVSIQISIAFQNQSMMNISKLKMVIGIIIWARIFPSDDGER